MDQLPNVPSTFTEFLWEILTVSDENDQNANEEPEPVSVQPDSATLQDQGDTVEPSSAHVHEPFEFFSPIDTNENLEIILKDIEGTSSITSCIENYDQIAKNLLKSECFPSRLRFSNNWRLIFSTEKHGVSFSTFYDRMDAYSEDSYDGSSSCPLVLVVKDDAGKIFGAFVTDAWRRNSGSGQFKSDTSVAGGIGRCYYGTGECFLFTAVGEQLECFKSTLKNDYYMISELDYIALGGGDGQFSLFIGDNFAEGFCGLSPTFTNSAPLCGPEDGKFGCVAVELWGIDR